MRVTYNDQLKPCPFCGGDAYVISEWSNRKRVSYIVECVKCGAIGADAGREDRTVVVASWNRRPTPWDNPSVRWICEEHPDKEFPHDDCGGPGMPDWGKIYSGTAHTPDRDNELIAVTRETLRCARLALREMNREDYYHNNGAAERELMEALAK